MRIKNLNMVVSFMFDMQSIYDAKEQNQWLFLLKTSSQKLRDVFIVSGEQYIK